MVTRVLLSVAAVMAAFASPASAQMSSLMGSVSYPEQVAQSRTAVLEVTLEDVSAPGGPAIVIASSRVARPGQSPVMFSLPYDGGRVVPANRYAVRARIVDGSAILFTSIASARVLTQGSGSFFNLSLSKPEPAPAPAPSVEPAPKVEAPATPAVVPAPVKSEAPPMKPVPAPAPAPVTSAPPSSSTAVADVTRIGSSIPAVTAPPAPAPKPTPAPPPAPKATTKTAAATTSAPPAKPTPPPPPAPKKEVPVKAEPTPKPAAAPAPKVETKPALPAASAPKPEPKPVSAPPPPKSEPKPAPKSVDKPAAPAQPPAPVAAAASAPTPKPAPAPRVVSTNAPPAPIAELPATFAGKLPCADCAGINYELTLSADATYALKKTFEGAGDRVQLEAGSWGYSSDRVVLALKSSHDAWSWFAVLPDNVLRAVDSRGQSIGLRAPADLRRSGAVNSTVSTAARTSATNEPVTAALSDAVWTLTELAGKPVRPASKTHRAIVIAFDESTRKFSGATGCNALEGEFQASWRTLMLTTTAPLPVCRIDQGTERAVSRTLKATRAYRVIGTTLDLFDEKGTRIARLEGARR